MSHFATLEASLVSLEGALEALQAHLKDQSGLLSTLRLVGEAGQVIFIISSSIIIRITSTTILIQVALPIEQQLQPKA